MAETIKQSVLNKSRKDKFILSLSTPEALKGSYTKLDRRTHHKSIQKVIPDSLQFSVFGCVVPQISVPSTNLPYAGQALKISTHARPEYGDISVSFNIDNQFNNYWYIWRWLDILNDSKYSEYDYQNQSEFTDKQPDELLDDYQANFTIFGLNEFNKKTVEFTYTKAFPISLAEISYNYRDPNEIECEFSFSFSQMIVNLL
jgi:hypothetical protein